MNRFLIVDGSNLLFQMFFGMPSRIDGKDGQDIKGTLGFVGALLRMIRELRPTHMAVLFDGEHHNPRKDLSCDYKANRPDFSEVPEEENPFTQLPYIYAALDCIGIRHCETEICETDDVIAAYAYTFGGDSEVIISSFDSDFFQLITDTVSVLRYRGDNTVICTPAYIKAKLGIEPRLYADYKSLTGDNADNIKGADKVGPKTAAALVNEYGTLEDIIASAESVKKPSVRASLMSCADRLRLNYKLIKLTGDAPLPFTAAEMEYRHRGMGTSTVLTAIGVR